MSRSIGHGSTNESTVVRFLDSSDGTPETGVTSATPGVSISYGREGAASVALSLSDLSALTDAHSDGGMIHRGDGYYRVDIPDAAFASGADGVLIHGTATGMVMIGAYHPLIIDEGGAGASAVTLTFTNDDGAIADADVWVTSDANGNNVVAGTKQTNSLGKVTFYLDDGATYYSWLQKDGVNSIEGDQFTAVAD